MTFEDTKSLNVGDILYSARYKNNSDDRPRRYKVTGKVKYWKRTPGAFRIPVKRGMYETGYITQYEAMDYEVSEKKAIERINGGF